MDALHHPSRSAPESSLIEYEETDDEEEEEEEGDKVEGEETVLEGRRRIPQPATRRVLKGHRNAR